MYAEVSADRSVTGHRTSAFANASADKSVNGHRLYTRGPAISTSLLTPAAYCSKLVINRLASFTASL
jgi:hypothetical protein